MQTWHLVLYKLHDIAGAQARERDFSIIDTILEKVADEWYVVDSRRTARESGKVRTLRLVEKVRRKSFKEIFRISRNAKRFTSRHLAH
jgi:hypothetical protein